MAMDDASPAALPGPAEPLAEDSRSVPPPQSKRADDFDAEIYQRHRNTTSHFKRCIDELLVNHNEQALQITENDDLGR